MTLPSKKPTLDLSVVIPVYNEEKSLPLLQDRLFPALDALGKSYEVIFVNDGSKDNSQAELEALFTKRPDKVRAIQLMRNAGQHPAIIAGFSQVRGEIVVTLDCDLQNPPEDIGKLVSLIEQGHDIAGGIRAKRQDKSWRKFVSNLANKIRERITNIRMIDQGSMLRAYRREIVDQIVLTGGNSPYIPAIAHFLATNPIEVPVGHEERAAGVSQYNVYKLLRLNFDLITSFSIVPLQIFTMVGMALSAASTLLVVYMGLRRIFLGPEVEGVFTLFAILFLLVSVTMTGLGLIGEYIGRIYMEVRARPQAVIRKITEQ
jgi:undecaprenyl-phosphate 4-deoxy-4-formamido-L-arabinose transferase